jgi:hypothetical protein
MLLFCYDMARAVNFSLAHPAFFVCAMVLLLCSYCGLRILVARWDAFVHRLVRLLLR